ncbi:MAG: hypothetical protein JOY61_08155 [Chloroflexi bacterium]|nr:hypothetical protein [Chloroflexota bacterium]
MKLHWATWLLRLLLLGTVAFQLVTRNTDGAVVAGEGFVVSLLPLLIQKLSNTHVPRPLEFAFVLGMALQFFSESTKLFELFYYWDKVVHPTLVALTALIAGWLLLGYRDAFRKRIPMHFVAAFGMLLGLSVGAFWEFVEFTGDWFGNSDLQKSNGDTLTDIISNNIGALVATLIGLWLYAHVIRRDEREDMGRIAAWMTHGPRRLLQQHGRVVGGVLLAGFVALVVAAVRLDQGTPALASGLQPGASQEWAFTSDPTGNTQVLSGDWVPDPRGICRENLDNPKPGSEKLGLLGLAPGSVFGDQPFTLQATYFEQRPDVSQGSEMAAGIAFGIRDANNFYVLEENALHDNLRLDRFIHGRRRDLREKLVRTHGNESHTLAVSVAGASITAFIDGSEQFVVDGLQETSGGIGLWARTAAATCFSTVSVKVGGE